MAIYDLLLEHLQNEGYRPKEESFGLVFKVEGLNFLYFRDEKDDQYFRLCLPGIFDVNNDNEYAVLKAMNGANASMKVVKLYIVGDEEEDRDVWVAFEILLDNTPDIGDFMDRAIGLLRAGRQDFYNRLQND
ncbi:MAG: hypothetical protein II609_04445 [Muribaculaceae bacterium]|jgi:hypothetical protein|nr:hypothetical protein [Muribaculaceae bacterium]